MILFFNYLDIMIIGQFTKSYYYRILLELICGWVNIETFLIENRQNLKIYYYI